MDRKKKERILQLKALGGFADFIGVIACAILLLLCVALLTSLIKWFSSDMTSSFAALNERVTQAILVE